MKKKKSRTIPKKYGAPKGSKRRALLNKAAIKLREKMEEKERAKKGFKSKKAKYSKKTKRK